MKNGIHFKISNNKKVYLYYKDDVLVDSLKIYNEFDNDSVDLFFKKYYNSAPTDIYPCVGRQSKKKYKATEPKAK